MNRQPGNDVDRAHAVTRRHILKASLTTGFGLGTASLLGTVMPTRTAAAAPVYGGHLTVLNVGYPEV
jgi:hypothetical protein